MRALALAMLLASAAGATPTDFRFEGVELSSVIHTTAVLGKFNALVAPDIANLMLNYKRQQIEPDAALAEVAALAGAAVLEVKDAGLRLFVVTRTPLPATAKTPSYTDPGPPTDWNFKSTDFSAIVATMGALGKFDYALGPGVLPLKMSLALREMPAAHAIYWAGTVAGLKVERSDSGSKPLYTIKR